jgi:DnaJ-class molecular chaperone
MVVAVRVIVPEELSEEQRELAERLGETLEPRNLRSRQGDGGSFFSRVRRAFG